MTTRALVLESEECSAVRDVPTHVLASGEVRLATLACGICGSDLRYYVGDNPWSQHTLGRMEPVAWGQTILGHEVCARITETAPDVENLRVGDVVAVLPSYPCGQCSDCTAGNTNLCTQVSHLGHGGGWPSDYTRPFFPGAMADSFVYYGASCFPVPLEKADAEEFALTDMVAVAVHSVKRATQIRARGLGAGASGLVIGCGQVGLSIAQTARAQGASVIGVDTGETARHIAAQLDISVMSSLGDLPGEARFDAIWDTVCSPDTITAAFAKLNPGGALVLLAPHKMD